MTDEGVIDNLTANAATISSANQSHPHDSQAVRMIHSSGDPVPAASAARATPLQGGFDQQWPADPTAYILQKKIGQGAFATVWRAVCTANNQDCAVKILDLEHVDTNFIDIRLEVQAMRLSSHPNVLACHAAFVRDTNLWLVTQLMRKGSSLRSITDARKKIAERLSEAGRDVSSDALLLEDHITYVLHETLLGLRYIHDNGQIHRDIKAFNILLDGDASVRIADFGVSGWLIHGGSQRENTKTFVGTPCWMAPEVMEQVHGYDYKADIWSLGITALELAMGYAPYAKYAPMKVLLLTIQEDPPSLETYDDCGDVSKWSKSFRSMIKLCLQKDPAKRPTIGELLAHKHFRQFADKGFREARRAQMKSEVCELLNDVGETEISEQNNLPGTAPVYVVSSTEENRPAGTTWVFSDGSQVLASSSLPEGDDDKGDFFDEFERQTAGEHFSAQQTTQSTNTNDETEATRAQQVERDEMSDFFDEFEKSTGGENFRKD